MTPAPPNEDIVARARYVCNNASTELARINVLLDCVTEIERLRAELEQAKADADHYAREAMR